MYEYLHTVNQRMNKWFMDRFRGKQPRNNIILIIKIISKSNSYTQTLCVTWQVNDIIVDISKGIRF